MKIMVVGSIKHQLDDMNLSETYKTNLKNNFGDASRALGKALAERNHEIYIGFPNWNYITPTSQCAAPFVIEGANQHIPKGSKRVTVILSAPAENGLEGVASPTSQFSQITSGKANINIQHDEIRDFDTKSGANIIPSLTQFDAVILLAGGDGTASIGYAAKALNVPVIAISSLGGTARNLYNDFLSDELQELYKNETLKIKHLRTDPYVLEDVFWTNNNAIKIIELTEQYVFYRRIKSNLLSAWLLALPILGIAALIGWIVMYVKTSLSISSTNSINQGLIFFALLALSTVIGTHLRILLDYRSGKIKLNFVQYFVEIGLSLIVAFGLALVYLVGGISFAGKVILLDATVKDEATSIFATVGLSLSILGLAAGALLPIQQLLSQLKKAVESTKLPEGQ